MSKRTFLLWQLALFLLISGKASADLTSTNYKADIEMSGAASPNMTSVNYALNASVDWIHSGNLAGTNYSVSGNSGINSYGPDLTIQTTVPGNYTKYFSDQSPSFTLTTVSADGDTLSYQAKQDGTLKDGPQASNVLTWAISAGDLGRRAVRLEVTDTEGTVSQDMAMFVLRRPYK